MNTFMRYMGAVVFILVMGLSVSATNVVNPAELSPVQRTEIGEDIVHYTFEVTVDTGPYGKIRLHRFVRETEPYQPNPNLKGMLLLPGSPATVLGTFGISLISNGTAWDHSLAVYLAKNNIDVWGMDYAWSLIPAERKDFHFMQDWTIVKDARHAETALSIVRSIRGYTGEGTGKLTLLGHSWGVIIGYAVLSGETQISIDNRNVEAFIPMDYVIKLSAGYSALREEFCTEADDYQAMWNSGTYADNLGLLLNYVGWVAESNPDGPSDIIPGFSNYQAFLYNADVFDAPWLWHLLGAYFDKDGYPTGLRFTDPELALDLFQAFAPYWPVKAEWEEVALHCDEVNVPGFEYMNQINVPILYVGAAGGIGEAGYYTLTLTGSEDISKFTVQLLPDKKRGYDFGHGDLVTARDAEKLVWERILNWINAH